MVPIGKHIFSFGIISSVLSLVWYVINNKHAEDYIIIYLSNLGYKMLEPYEGKLSRTVLRRVGASNRSFLFGGRLLRTLFYSTRHDMSGGI